MQIPSTLLFTTSTVDDGNMSFNFGAVEEVLSNRTNFCARNNNAYQDTICMQCSHGETIVLVDSKNHQKNQGATADKMLPAEVLVTQEPNLPLMLLTADCLPTAFYDPVSQTIALAHFSRQTIGASLPQKTVAWLQKNLRIDPSNLQVLVGPYIHKVSYAFPLPLQETPVNLTAYISNVNGHAYIDLAAAHNNQLIDSGVKEENITLSEIDTFSSPLCYSHYESIRNDQKPHGRLATILVLKD